MKTPYFPSIKKEKQNWILFKSQGASPESKTCISYNGFPGEVYSFAGIGDH